MYAALALKGCQRRVWIFVCYAPTADKQEDAAQFFEQLIDSVNQVVPSRDLFLILGDMNAAVPPIPRRAPFACGATNASASLLTDLLNGLDTILADACLRKRTRKQFTFLGPRCRKAWLDHIVLPSRWRRCIRQVQFIRPIMIPSDHKLLTVSVKFHMRLYTPPRQPYRPYWGALKDPATRDKLDWELTERLWDQSPSEEELQKVVFATAAEILPKAQPRRTGGLPWEQDPAVRAARCALQRARTVGHHTLSTTSVQELLETYNSAVEKYFDRELQNMAKMDNQGRFKFVWRAIHHLTGKKAGSSLRLEGNTPEEKKQTAMQFFQSLLSPATKSLVAAPPTLSLPLPQPEVHYEPSQPPIPHGCFRVDRISPREVVNNARRMQGFKAPGCDGIPMACFRLPQVAHHTARHMNKMLIGKSEVPECWTKSVIVPVPKKPGATSLDAHRGISLLNSAPKLFNRVILSRIQAQVDPCLRPEQNGFRPNRSTIQHVMVLRRLMEEAISHKLEAHFIFVDYKKAFDSVDRSQLPIILEEYGIPQTLRDAICGMYACTKAMVRTADGTTAPFTTSSGVMQGDSMAPFLFLLFMDHVIRHAIPDDNDGFVLERRRSSRHPEKKISVLLYADDIVLLSSTFEGAQAMLTRLEQKSLPLGLLINVSKTKAVSLNHSPERSFTTSAGAIESCSSFVYLGCMVPRSDDDISRRRSLAWMAMGKLRPLLHSSLQLKVKAKLFAMLVETVLLYGAETWTLCLSAEKKLDATHARLLRSAMNLCWPNKTTNDEMYRMAELKRPSVQLRERRRTLLQLAHSTEHLPHLKNTILWCPLQHVGRPNHRALSFPELIFKDASAARHSLQSWCSLP
jgi:hypothetical protein